MRTVTAGCALLTEAVAAGCRDNWTEGDVLPFLQFQYFHIFPIPRPAAPNWGRQRRRGPGINYTLLNTTEVEERSNYRAANKAFRSLNFHIHNHRKGPY